MSFTEKDYENAVIELFRGALGYGRVYAPCLTRDYADPLYTDELQAALRRVNPKLPEAALSEAVYRLRRPAARFRVAVKTYQPYREKN